MTATKKSIRFLTVLALTFAMVLSIISIPASAAGVEISTPTFVLNPTYLSSVITMEENGRFYVTGKFLIDDKTVYTNPVNCTLQIRSTNGTVLASKTMLNGGYKIFSCDTNVSKGQQVQIYMSVFDSVTGETRYAIVSYSTVFR